LHEIKALAAETQADLIIFDQEMTASQLKNVEDAIGQTVIDRTMLILDIFAQRARSKEGRLQVELAQQKYILPRLMGLGHTLSRLGGGIGTRGPGESKLESDRRHIRRRIDNLTDELKLLEKRRTLLRDRRKKDEMPTVAIVGYTNVGKSTLLNAMTQAEVLTENKLFATLDPTSRGLVLPDGRTVLIIDTVGLIRRLPHHLIEAFHSTLEESVAADLILNVCDASGPDAMVQLSVAEKLLDELGVKDTPVITVFNKCDRLPENPTAFRPDSVYISALTGQGLDKLKEMIAQMLPGARQKMTLLIPYAEGTLAGELRKSGGVFKEEFTDDGLLIHALIDPKQLERYRQYSVSPPQ
ncbi:MAG: GTPase HflX, partial [Bacillota bacterium]|nr:GTPase HflX [Bacillota bacterium]